MGVNPSKPTAADAVRAAVIRRPTGAAAPAAATAFQGGDVADTEAMMRTTLQMAPPLRIALKRAALDDGTTMSGVIRAAIDAGLARPDTLVAASMPHRRVAGGARTTLDLPREVHKRLKRLAADHDTTVQALVLAAIGLAHPSL
jgi:hypothetical protein